jgi:AcrR family transcriptional regulator
MDSPDTRPRSDAAEHLKAVARLLFAGRGVDGVTVREIAEAAGQKNHAAVGYHFGSKDALVREIVVDGAVLIDRRRNDWLDRLEAEGGPRTVREIVDVLIYAGVDMAPGGGENGYSRFVVMLGMTHRQFFMDTIAGRWNAGYLRCLEHLRRLMPDMPAAMKNQRFVFMGAYLGGVLAAREAELADASREHPSWQSDATLAHFARTMTALIEVPGV